MEESLDSTVMEGERVPVSDVSSTSEVPLITRINTLVEKRNFKLPVFNAVALEIHEAITGDADIAVVKALILKDQALASEILRMANSALFSGLTKLESIQQALVRLGTAQVLSVVMFAAQKQAFVAKHPYLVTAMKDLWCHATASAAGCRWVAEKYNYVAIREQAFLAGLLHDLGSLVVLRVLDEVSEMDGGLMLTDTLMDELMTTLHTDYGASVMQSWELPSVYCDVARLHHDSHSEFGENEVLLLIVRLVDNLNKKLGIGCVRDDSLVLEATPEAQALGIKPVHLAELEIFLEEMNRSTEA